MADYSSPQHVYVENEWFDGPMVGVADVDGKPHRFFRRFDDAEDEYMGTFLVWPIEDAELKLEQEQWQIFAAWNEEYEAGRVGVDSHPGHPGTNERWGEIDALLKSNRVSAPENATPAAARVVHIERDERYPSSGPSYRLCWKLL
jgi:hypothetical protein